MNKILPQILVCSTLLLLAPTLNAAELLFKSSSISRQISANLLSNTAGKLQPIISGQLGSLTLNKDEYIIDLPDQQVEIIFTPNYSEDMTALGKAADGDIFYRFSNGQGSARFTSNDGQITHIHIYDIANQRVYDGAVDIDGQVILFEKDVNDYVCIEYPKIGADPNTAFIGVDPTPEDVSLSTVQNLQSLPGSNNVLFIDYWGGVVTGSRWTANYNNGNPINYPAYDLDGNPASFSANERHHMYTAWAEAAEDYAPFDINVTTNISVFNASSNRSRIVVTRDQSWLTDNINVTIGGIAGIGTFGDNTNDNNVGWTFNAGWSTMGMTHSHESGHQMGLSHDGVINVASYYGGHNNWGPVMGAPFGADYVQWSKGEYSNADRTQDDIAMIKGKLGQIADDVGNNNGAAKSLNISNSDFIGQIRPKGLTGNLDTDVFSFQQGVNSEVTVGVRPLFESNNPAKTGANLSFRAQLRDSLGNSIAQKAPATIPSDNIFSFKQNLSPGTYYLTVKGESANSNPSTGFSEYGNGGFYQVSVSGGFLSAAPDLLINNTSISPNSVDAESGGSITVTTRVKNIGVNTSSNYTVRFYRSNDQTISTSDILLSTENRTNLPQNQTSSNITHTFNAPAGHGQYFYGACITSSSPTEDDTGNNCGNAVTLSVNAPDLVINNTSITPNYVNPNSNESVILKTRVRNIDAGTAKSYTVRFYRSDDQTITNSDEVLTTKSISPDLLENQISADIQHSFTAPQDKGQYYYGACITSASPNENNTNNNCGSAETLNVNPDDGQICIPIKTKKGALSLICL